jgi:hypothetical protein
MSNSFEILGSCFNAAGAFWLLIDAFRIRQTIHAEHGAAKLRDILNKVGAGDVLTDKEGKPLDSEKALRLWFASRTIAWNWVALALVSLGFALDLIGKLR